MRHHQDRAEDMPDGRDEPWAQLWTDIADLLVGNEYRWAENSLRGIQMTIERTHHVTAAQRRAVQNIARGVWPRRRV